MAYSFLLVFYWHWLETFDGYCFECLLPVFSNTDLTCQEVNKITVEVALCHHNS